jgi:hypothetical protein
VTSATAAGATGTITPVSMGETAALQQQNADLSWTTVGSDVAAADGTFTISAGLVAGSTVRVVVTPATGYVPGASAPAIVSG